MTAELRTREADVDTERAPDTAPVTLWLCPNDGLDPETARLLADHWLDAREQKTAGKFLFERDRLQYLIAHTLVRRALSLEAGRAEAELVIWRSARGRPFLRPATDRLSQDSGVLDFNLSHAGGYNLLGIVRQARIGVDVERVDDRDQQAVATILNAIAPTERAWAEQPGPGRERDRRALRIWTLKEAYSKARGLGLGIPFDSFEFTLDDERGVRAFTPPADDEARPWRFVELEPVPGVLVAVAVPAAAGDAAIHLNLGFPWSRSAPQEFPLPPPVGERV
ncbi:4'-phosphopantetheinyl transferase superfamily protein [Streptomyces sp. ITFR-16]|uniref:4'-phosphopantetheinyl transferase family protein n=1 Tax=Streptomyces sp. ITFR-16 TaxID=3075198 RepID=UPI002889D9C9|nr:4'-phosphopantetheinyl transferase superfamily protein [Streptomyces sp. ITFR-16]WNI27240.1 4'-phosphopantetheinyl transferase superfamily protein [Streptomyces sp. ITFR-16]